MSQTITIPLWQYVLLVVAVILTGFNTVVGWLRALLGGWRRR